MSTMLDWAQSYQRHGWKVYPLAPGTRTPLKGSHGFKDGTTDPAQATRWWHEHPNANIGIDLTGTGVVMLDLDQHAETGADGIATLKRLAGEGKAGELPPTYTETTPSGNGIHRFYSYPSGLRLTAKAGLFGDGSGIDYNAQGVPVAPSWRNGARYKPLGRLTLADITPAPDWLVAELQRVTVPRTSFGGSSPTVKRWAGRVLDEMVAGAGAGGRNNFLTSLAGKLFRTGADPKTVYNLLLVTNSAFLSEPLPSSEVNRVFGSVLKREQRKQLDG